MQKRDKVLIIGSSGMLGVDLSCELAESYELYGFDIIHSPRSTVHGFKKGDISNKNNVFDILEEVKPKFVIHTAAMTDVDGCELDREKAYKINTDGTANVALGCKKSGAILIYISTDFVFDGKKKTPYKETDKTAPLSVYGDSKLKGEKAVKKELEQYFILRTSWLYGKCGKNFVDTIAGKAVHEKVLKVVDDQVGSPTYTVDLAGAIHLLLTKRGTRDEGRGMSGIYHVSNSGSVTWYEYAKEIVKLTGSGTRVIPISSEELNRPAKRPAMSVMDNSKFNKFTGHKLRDWKDALSEYISKR